MEDWDDIWRRNQFLCAGLARRHPGLKILFVGLPRDFTHAVRTRNLRCFVQAATWKPPGFPEITVTHPPKWFPNSSALGQRLNEAVFRRHIAKVARALGLRRPLLWLNPHSALHMVGKFAECAVIYDITDDWTQLTQRPWLKELTRRQDRALCQVADAVIVCSEHLRQLKAPLVKSLHLVPNGVDAAHYLPVLDSSLPLPADAARWRHPVLGYTGTVHPDRVDLDLVEKLARRLPSATLALVGPAMIDAATRRKLEACGNVALLGPKPYAELPAYMRAFDVCITPHLLTPFTESLNPIKLWEYLAAGKPIVATPVAGFRNYPKLVYLARTVEEFAQRLNEALTESQDSPKERRQEALKHSWDARLDTVEEVIARCLDRKPTSTPA